MELLIINQPLNNRGDEAAHKALVRTIIKHIPDANIIVLFDFKANKDSVRQFSVDHERVKYICHSPLFRHGFRRISELGLKKKWYFLWNIHPGIRSWMGYFKHADYVVCAPGGINMGGFQSWYHLFYLYCAKIYKKPIAYYGRSVGPFPTKTVDNITFKQISLELLNYFDYISIRDKKSEMELERMKIKYQSVVDTAFLDDVSTPIPDEIESIISGPFVVFVPNTLIWHYNYKGKGEIDQVADFYIDMLKKVLNRYPNHNIVMLPQIFNSKPEENDVNFFRYIKSKAGFNRVIVIQDIYSSDVQQMVIAKSEMVIGARYHSIVFAINNSVPFIALSYEHKISGLLDTLNVSESCIDITEIFDKPDSKKEIFSKFEKILAQSKCYDSTRVKTEAKRIAYNGFDTFKQSLKEYF